MGCIFSEARKEKQGKFFRSKKITFDVAIYLLYFNHYIIHRYYYVLRVGGLKIQIKKNNISISSWLTKIENVEI